MLSYRPLNVDKNEIRVLELAKPTPCISGEHSLFQCSLKYVSLDDYTEEYANFLELRQHDESAAWPLPVWATTPPSCGHSHEDLTQTPPSQPLATGSTRTPVDQRMSSLGSTYCRYMWGDFAALSYECGGSARTGEILVDNHKVAVTRNLEAALQHISTWWLQETNHISLWIDALCINQQDIVERNHQVKRMASIYSGAISVLLWTGPAIQNETETCRLLSQIYQIAATGESLSNWNSELTKYDNILASLGISELSNRSYWKRLWVIQEFYLAGRNALVCFGIRRVNILAFFAAANLLGRVASVSTEVFKKDAVVWIVFFANLHLGIDNLVPLMRIFHKRSTKMPLPDLATLLVAAGRAEQTDSRDKIYGLLGLVNPEIRSLILPDYGKACSDVYRDFVTAVIQTTGKLDIIYQRPRKLRQGSQLPSWVPDWSIKADTCNPIDLPREIDSDELVPQVFGDFRSALDTTHVFRIGKDPNELLCRGFRA
ncbi:uncharacterized protein JN550_003390 [Neoarthrinium moseri]|uniref:uncharacterized protein n=1 Tax=Neoarthrinium moseri TaxID=1658444 RepID=UPI001FDB252A|nr:uncharacterized protein JN550_003390 [Neoarthrinium moseri]KAI1873137.1 hypothetical protein JN550_003390 [Neoarthrinium moseri]